MQGTGGAGGAIASVLDTKLPLIDRSVSELVDLAAALGNRIDAIMANPSGSIQALESQIRAALGMSTGPPITSFDVSTGTVYFNFSYGKSVSISRPFSLSLAGARTSLLPHQHRRRQRLRDAERERVADAEPQARARPHGSRQGLLHRRSEHEPRRDRLGERHEPRVRGASRAVRPVRQERLGQRGRLDQHRPGQRRRRQPPLRVRPAGRREQRPRPPRQLHQRGRLRDDRQHHRHADRRRRRVRLGDLAALHRHR